MMYSIIRKNEKHYNDKEKRFNRYENVIYLIYVLFGKATLTALGEVTSQTQLKF